MVGVTDPLWEHGDGQTVLHPDDRVGLKLTWVRTRGELNAAEQANIVECLRSLRQPATETLLDDSWLRGLHKRMFGDVWGWAGKYRTTNPNLGIDFTRIAEAVRNLVGNASVWVGAGEDPVVLGARFHHQLVAIHPFPNGNGRNARTAAGLLVASLGGPELTWGAGYPDIEQARSVYIAALRAADAGDPDPLIAFITS